MMAVRVLLLFFCLYNQSLPSVALPPEPLPVHSADNDAHFQDDIDFIMHLMSRGEHDEALFLLEDLTTSRSGMADTLFYLRGWNLYQQKVLLPSAEALLKVSATSPLFVKSRFFGAYNMAHAGYVSRGLEVLAGWDELTDGMHLALRNFQLSGMSLLSRDYESFSRRAEQFSGRYHAFSGQESSILLHHQALMDIPSRSPVVAGMLSAAVPGLGKVYAGKAGEGIAGFLYTLAFAATAYDFYRGAGPRSALFIISASVAGIFYVGNVWGSVVAVNRKKYELYNEIDQRILFDLHIPLRSAFN